MGFGSLFCVPVTQPKLLVTLECSGPGRKTQGEGGRSQVREETVGFIPSFLHSLSKSRASTLACLVLVPVPAPLRLVRR